MNNSKWQELGPFVVFDVETTGMSPARDRIVQLAAQRIDRDGTVSEFESLINPGRPIPFAAMNVHHITDQMVADAPRFTDVGYRFLDFCRGATLVAHNARFDLAFLQESLCRSGLPLWKGRTMDSVILAKRAFPGLPSYSLQNLRCALSLGDDPGLVAHRADSDVVWTVRLLEKILVCLIEREQSSCGGC